ncbi:MAG: hypothetical protein K2X03_23730 [Bryobacteraceae bacterium]|nr:hypothetical protein [Bryobacteraceae bacterium]
MPTTSVPLSDFRLLTRLEQAGRWFLDSGIQDPSGGVARYYQVDEGRNLPVSTEITGYAVASYLELYQRTKQGEYLDAAERAGRYLLGAWNRPLRTMPFEADEDRPQFAYFFDLGIIARALLRLWRVTGETWQKELAHECGRSMMEDFAAEKGYHCILRLPEKKPLPAEPWWSREPGAFQLKAALAWRELAELLPAPAFLKPFERQLEFSLLHWRQLVQGAEGEPLMDRLHPLGYFLEGLIPVLDRPACAQALREGIGVYEKLLRATAPAFARADAYAQLLRARLFAEAAGVLPLDRAAAREEHDALTLMQQDADDPRRRGGFAFGTRQGQLLPFANPVSTAFGLQASAYWYERKAGAFRADWRELI